MPIIGGNREGQRAEVSSPVPIDSPTDRMVVGNAIAGLGRDIQKSAGYLHEYQVVKDHTKRNMERTKLKGALQMASEEAKDEALRLMDTPDQDPDIGPSHYSTQYQAKMKEIMKNIKDPDLRALVQSDALTEQAQTLSKVNDISRKKMVDYISHGTETVLQTQSALVRKDSSNLDKALETWEGFINQSPFLFKSQGQQDLAKKAGRLQFQKDAVASLLDKDMHEDAKRLVHEKFAGSMDPEARDKLLAEIEKSEDRHFNDQLKIEAKAEREEKEVRRKFQQKNLAELLGDAENMPPEKLRKKIRTYLAQDKISATDYRLANGAWNMEERADDAAAQLEIFSSLDKKSPQEIEKELRTREDLGAGTRVKLIKQMKQMQIKRADPVYRAEDDLAKASISSAVSSGPFAESFDKKEAARVKAEAMADYERYKAQGMGPAEASQFVIEERGRGLRGLPKIPGIPDHLQDTKEDLETARQMINQMYPDVSDDRQKAKKTRAWELFDARLNAIKREEQLQGIIERNKKKDK